ISVDGPAPYAVVGYPLRNPDSETLEVLPKGIKIRTPKCATIPNCLQRFEKLHQTLQAALLNEGYQAVALSHHPTQDPSTPPKDGRSREFWMWALSEMLC